MNMFERASRAKLRIPTQIGDVAVENLWDFPLTSDRKVSLDAIAQQLHKRIADAGTVSFVEPTKKSEENALLQLAFDIVLHIIDVKKAELERLTKLRATREQRETLLRALEQRKNAELNDKTSDELAAMIAELDAADNAGAGPAE